MTKFHNLYEVKTILFVYSATIPYAPRANGMYLEKPYQDKSILSLKKAVEVTHNMYQITYTLPVSKHTENHLLKIDQEQQELYHIIQKNF